MDSQLIALYELKRQSFLLGYIQHTENFSDALAYAYYNRVAPVFHENIAHETYGADPFDTVYAVKRDFVLEVLKFIDQCYLDGNYKDIKFYNLEEKFGGYKTNRIELIRALEYTRISGRFDRKVWEAIESNAPTEATPLNSSFSPKNLYFD